MDASVYKVIAAFVFVQVPSAFPVRLPLIPLLEIIAISIFRVHDPAGSHPTGFGSFNDALCQLAAFAQTGCKGASELRGSNCSYPLYETLAIQLNHVLEYTFCAYPYIYNIFVNLL